MTNVRKFYPPIGGSYYVFELQHILGISRSSVYRILNQYDIKIIKSKLGRRVSRKVPLISLLNLVRSSCFNKYIKLLRKSEAKDNENTKTNDINYKIKPSRLHIIFKTPQQLLKMRLIDLNVKELEDAIYAGLIPIVTVNGEQYVLPDYINTLKAIRRLS